MTFVLRNLAAHDLPALLSLADGSPEAPKWTRSDYEKLLPSELPDTSSRNVRCRLGIIALDGTKLVGFAAAAWLPLEAAAEIESIVVDPGYRRQGAGSALLRGCMEWAEIAGATAVRLEVRASNDAAIALYGKAGFSKAGVRRAYYAAPVEDALILLGPLRSPGPL